MCLHFFYRLPAVSLFFRFSESNARARGPRSRETRETRAASVTRVAICLSRVLLDGLQKTERLLVVYFFYSAVIVNSKLDY